MLYREFAGSPVVGTLDSAAGGLGSVPDNGTKILPAMWHGQIKKENQRFINTNLVTPEVFLLLWHDRICLQ